LTVGKLSSSPYNPAQLAKIALNEATEFRHDGLASSRIKSPGYDDWLNGHFNARILIISQKQKIVK